MLVSFVLRLVPAALAVGDVVGQAEHVETGATSTFRNVDELVAWLCADRHLDVIPGELI